MSRNKDVIFFLAAKINLECQTLVEYSSGVLVQVFVSDSLWRLAAVPESGRQPLLLYAPNTLQANGLQKQECKKTKRSSAIEAELASKEKVKRKSKR